ncbi:neuroligin-3 [Hyalella azteca]|uniref:Carboxylic ester hydrolase n=1 Tax=Hyalella azteca TaxID=294128 RepID=A0A979FPK0_HYAAZ|nr:neuroligin-3 [Hyalella azteca]
MASVVLTSLLMMLASVMLTSVLMLAPFTPCVVGSIGSSARGDVVLRSSAGAIRGQIFRMPDGSTGSRFLGINYAKPPINDRRFRAPEAAEAWEGVYDATNFGPSCLQPHMYDVWMMAPQPNRSFGSASVQQEAQEPWLYLVQDYLLHTSEDCLSLNVYTPFVSEQLNTSTESASEWLLHRAGYCLLQVTASCRLLPPAGYCIVQVTASCRSLPPAGQCLLQVTASCRSLPPAGFLSTGDAAAPGNWGLLDQRLALTWLQDHVASFGGDPTRVLLAGNSAGGASVLLHLMSPRSRGLFSRVAAMSGCALGPWAIQRRPLHFARRLGLSLACDDPDSRRLVDCLRGVDAHDLLTNATEQLTDGLWIAFAAVVEGEDAPDAFLPLHPKQALMGGHYSTDVPVFLTVTRDEVSIWYKNTAFEPKVFQLENWIGRIVRHIFAPLELNADTLSVVTHAVLGEYLYSQGYEPSLKYEASDLMFEHPAFVPSDMLTDGRQTLNGTAAVSIIASLISDVGLLVPCVEEAGLLAQRSRVYVAQFAFVSPDDVKILDEPWIGAYHEHELQYLFGLPYWHLKNTLRHPSNKYFSDVIMTIFSQFAEQGYPNGPESSDPWPQYRRPGDAVLSVGINTTVKYNFLLDRVTFWKKFLPLLTNWPFPTRNGASSMWDSVRPLTCAALVLLPLMNALLTHAIQRMCTLVAR